MTEAPGGLSAQTLFDVIMALVSGLGGWVLGTMWQEIKAAREDHADLLKTLPETYARRDDVAEALERINKGLERIFDKLDGKADKTHR
jgi:hypothetical protein